MDHQNKKVLATEDRSRSRSNEKATKVSQSRAISNKILPTSKPQDLADTAQTELSETKMQIVKKDLENAISREEKIKLAKERLLQRRQR